MSILAYYQNVRSIKRKNEIRARTQLCPYQLVALSETWLNDDDNSLQYFDDSFVVHRNDRDLENSILDGGGGSLIAIKRHISAIRLTEWENQLPFENVWIAINKNDSSGKIYVNVCYIRPRTRFNVYEEYFSHLSEKICNSNPNSDFIILGDFNMGSNISWILMDNDVLPYNMEGQIANELVNTLSLTDMKQKNNTRNSLGRILDLVLTTKNNIIVHPAEPLSKVDPYHPPIEFKIESDNIRFLKSIKTNKLNFYKTNYELINHELGLIDWNDALNSVDIDTSIDLFYNSINHIIARHTPIIKPKSQEFPNYYSNELIALLRDKEHFRKQFNQTNDERYRSLYIEKRRKFKREKKKCEFNLIENIENNIKLNTKAFFSYTKSLKKTNKLPSVMKLNNNSSDNPHEIAFFLC